MNSQRNSLIHHISHQVLPSHFDTWWTTFPVHAPLGRGSNHSRRRLRLLLRRRVLSHKKNDSYYAPLVYKLYYVCSRFFFSCFLVQHVTNLLRGGTPPQWARPSHRLSHTDLSTGICWRRLLRWGTLRWADELGPLTEVLATKPTG